MKKNLIITVLCVIVAIVLTVTLILFVKTLGKQKNNDNNEQAENAPTTEIDGEQTSEPSIGESDNEETPDTNVSTESGDTPVSNETTEPDADTNETYPPETIVQKPPVTNNTEDQNTGSSVQPETPTPEIIPENVSESYKDFSLTKGMDAKTAYEYLNSFLSSKYSILTNKQNKVSSDYAPTDLIVPSGCQYQMERVAANALVELLSDAKSNGIYDLVLYSGYRTYASQKNKYETRTNKYLNQGYSQADAEAKAGEYIAPPGASEHHTGLAADVCSSTIVNKYGYLSDEFDTTRSYQWMKNNCAQYGFIIRYQKGKESITGYSYEPWHLRYLGKDHAVACTALGITYEEYHALLIKYRDQAKAEAGV